MYNTDNNSNNNSNSEDDDVIMGQVDTSSGCEHDNSNSGIDNINKKSTERNSSVNWKYDRDLIRMGLDEIKVLMTAHESY